MITEQEYEAYLKRIDEIFEVDDPNSPEGQELTRLVDLVVEYEDKFYPIGEA